MLPDGLAINLEMVREKFGYSIYIDLVQLSTNFDIINW